MDQKAITLEQAVWRLTGQPAEIFDIPERGLIKAGYKADLVAFDPDTVATLPNERWFDFPDSTERLVSESVGVKHVWVAGTLIRRDEVDLPDANPGMLLRI
jgi:N-acyl-D-aspartate/D-glutamate deacylase